MIDASLFRRLYLGSAVLCLLGAIVTFALWRSAHISAGVVAGGIVGIFPFATWQIVGKLLDNRNGRIAAAGITLVKYGVLIGGLYLLFVNKWVHPWAFMGGMLAVTAVFFVLGIARLAVTPSKEAA